MQDHDISQYRYSAALHPFGFDAFGLPAEQYAIETGQHPAATTTRNIDTMRRQLQRLGLAHGRIREPLSPANPDHDETGLPLAVPESMLPVELPPVADFRPQQPVEGFARGR